MLLLDTDILIDLLRQYQPAVEWFGQLDRNEEIYLSGYVVMELLQGCRNRQEQASIQQFISCYAIVWPTPVDCDKALDLFAEYHLSHNVGLLDALIGQTAISLGLPLHTFNDKHYRFIARLKTIQPYEKSY